ncbi:MAG: hypothetical protein WBE48_09310 [Xanthobacteraceae bacterium]
MSAENERKKPQFEVAAFLPIFGLPPIYRSENIAHYEGMRDQLIGCFAPKDFFELNLVMEMVNDAWQIKRGNWHKALAVERWSQKSLEFQTKRLELQQSRQDTQVEREAEATIQQPSDIGGLIRLEDKFVSTIPEVDHAVTWTAQEITHNAALERSMAFQDGLDKMIANATVRSYKAFESLEHYRQVFRPQLRGQAEAIIEAAHYESQGSHDESRVFQEYLDELPSPSIVAQAENNNASQKSKRIRARR